jgi:hypothetical protein
MITNKGVYYSAIGASLLSNQWGKDSSWMVTHENGIRWLHLLRKSKDGI